MLFARRPLAAALHLAPLSPPLLLFFASASTSCSPAAASASAGTRGGCSAVRMDSGAVESTGAVWSTPSAEPKSVSIGKAIFCNRSLNMRNITAVGFDMDYTLAQYKPETFEALAYYGTIEKLVKDLRYPEEMLGAPSERLPPSTRRPLGTRQPGRLVTNPINCMVPREYKPATERARIYPFVDVVPPCLPFCFRRIVGEVTATMDVDEEKLLAAMEDGEELSAAMEDGEKLPVAMEDDEEKMPTAMEDGEEKLSAAMEDGEKLPVAMEDGEEKMPTAMEDGEEKLSAAMEDGEEKLPTAMVDQLAAEALIHLASLPVHDFDSSFYSHEAFKTMGPLLIPLYFGAYTSDVREAAKAIDEIRRGKSAVVDDSSTIIDDDNLDDAIKVLRILGFNV